jgi:hypothetical protein
MIARALITGVAALFLAMGAAQATEDWLDRCGKYLIHTYGYHGYMFFLMPKGASRIDDDDRKRQLPGKLFRIDDDGNLYFRGRKCKRENGE